MNPTAFATSLGLAAICFACGPDKPPVSPTTPADSAQPATGPVAVAVAVAPPPSPLATPTTCANKSCFGFEDGGAALRALLTEKKPLAIGFGEAHTPAGFVGRTTVHRFTDDLLPVLAPQASALLVELLAPASGCETAKQAVKKEADAVTTGQSEGNQSEYTVLGKRARELGLVPDILRASCDDLRAIQAAGELGVVTMMETIARLTGAAVEERSKKSSPERPLVLAYGGALHNDATPREGRETWSYGPRLETFTGGRYLEIDLVLPSLVTDTPAWQSFGWYQALQTLERGSQKTWLIENGPSSYALVLPDEASK